MSFIKTIGILFLFITFQNTVTAQKPDLKLLHGLQARSIGPAGMSGRVTAIDVVKEKKEIIYVGTASGGLWKSENGGTDWSPIFDSQPVASIGAIAIDQRVPDVIWVGTGEGNPRNSQTSGNGIYKSIDGGKTWKHLGLENTRNIHRVIISPLDRNTIYVAALGSAFGDSKERGVYKSTDGGISWFNILFVDERTGAAELVMDPSNPEKLLVSMWEYRREPWFFRSGGKSSGIYITYDGGSTWKKLGPDEGLPSGEIGRAGLAFAKSNPKIIYALIESKKTALYRSTNGGFTWAKTTDQNISDRPFYYAELYVDPMNENRVYHIHSNVTVSEDGGKSFNRLISWGDNIHPDHHAWYIHPDNPNFIIDGNDGGLAISYDRGVTWRFVENLPVAQFYHIAVDDNFPYNVYGGMQDNGSWKGPNESFLSSGIPNSAWQMVSFGDGFDVRPDPQNNRFGYSMSQGGNLYRFDELTGETEYIMPVHPEGIKLRFNWNAGIATDPFDKNVVYYGSQFLHKSVDKGQSWEIISPDLTTNDTTKQKQMESGGLTYDVTGAENHTTIITIEPSPLKQGVIWVGTDDGNIQVTTDAGKTWTNTIKNVKGVPPATWVPHIHASYHRAGEAFAVFDNHRRDDWNVYVYHTTDFGATWKSIVSKEDSIFGYALTIVQDSKEPSLLFLGTEFGLYISLNYGKDWFKWTNGFPTVSTMCITEQKRETDLVIGTFGRSAYVLDDYSPLRDIAKKGIDLLSFPLHVFPSPDAYLLHYKWLNPGTPFHGAAEYFGKNPISGGIINFIANLDTSMKNTDGGKPNDTVKVEIKNSKGEIIRTFTHKVKNGFNRISWNLTRKGIYWPSRELRKESKTEPGGASVTPGLYNIILTFNGLKDSTTITVKKDPRALYTDDDLIAQEKAILDFYNTVEKTSLQSEKLAKAKNSIDLLQKRLEGKTDSVAVYLIRKSNELIDSIKTLQNLIFEKEVQGIFDDSSVLMAYINSANYYLSSNPIKPGQNTLNKIRQAENQLAIISARVSIFFDKEWKEFFNSVTKSSIGLIDEL